MVEAVRRHYVDTSWGQVHVRTSGTRSRELPVVLLHQTASSGAMYEALMAELKGYWVIAPDTPGFGGTPAPHEPATIPLYARVLREALRRLEVDRCFLFGHHTGASIAVQMTVDRPELTAKLALSGPPLLTSEQRTALRANIDPVVLDAEGDYLTRVWRRLRAKDGGAPLSLIHRETVLTLLAGERYHEAYEAVVAHPFEALLRSLTCPTLVLAGDADTLHSSLAPAFASLRGEGPHALRSIPGGTTYLADRWPALLASELLAFFV